LTISGLPESALMATREGAVEACVIPVPLDSFVCHDPPNFHKELYPNMAESPPAVTELGATYLQVERSGGERRGGSGLKRQVVVGEGRGFSPPYMAAAICLLSLGLPPTDCAINCLSSMDHLIGKAGNRTLGMRRFIRLGLLS
jgi:hypothetical protein